VLFHAPVRAVALPVYVELNGKSFVRDARFKLTNKGELFDLSNAPFEEKPVASDTSDEAAKAARARLQKVLDDHPTAPAGPADATEKANRKAKRQARRR
jgi:arylsulfatase A